jgi:hypothetical protein
MELIGDSGYVDDNFNMYVMYRPSDKDQWLPLGTVAWGSAGQAKNEGGKWMLIPGSDMAFVANTTEETEVHPFWSDNTDVILHNPITVP